MHGTTLYHPNVTIELVTKSPHMKRSAPRNELQLWHNCFRMHFKLWTPPHVLALARIVAAIYIAVSTGPAAATILKTLVGLK